MIDAPPPMAWVWSQFGHGFRRATKSGGRWMDALTDGVGLEPARRELHRPKAKGAPCVERPADGLVVEPFGHGFRRATKSSGRRMERPRRFAQIKIV